MIDLFELMILNYIEEGVVLSVSNDLIEITSPQGRIKRHYHTLNPIPLTSDWLIRMKDNKNKSTFPDWIKYVHEAQNWYYWNNNKTELNITWK